MALDDRISSCDNLAASFRAASVIYAGNVAQLFRTDGDSYSGKKTFSEMYSDIRSVASGLIELGFSQNDKAGIFSQTRPEWNIADVAIMSAGGASVGIYVTDNPDNIEHKINDTELKFVFLDNEKRLMRLLELPPTAIPSLKHIIMFDPLPNGISDRRLVSISDLLVSSDHIEEVDSRIDSLPRAASARIIYTTGTVGKAKGAVLSHLNLLSNLRSVSSVLNISDSEVTFSHLPTAHILQAMISNMTLLSGSALAYSRKQNFLPDLSECRPTIFPGVPKVFYTLQDIATKYLKEITDNRRASLNDRIKPETSKEIVKRMGLDRLSLCLSGAAKLDPAVIHTFSEKLGITILEGYGMSETSPVLTVNTMSENKPGTVGKVVPGVEIKIVDEEGRRRPPGVQGEIAVRGDNVFSGYLNLPVINASVLTRDKFFYTGDLGLIDHDGYLVILGRRGNQVKFANGNYYDLEEIAEKFLQKTFLIQQAAAAGEQKDFPVAVVSLAEDLEVVVRYADSLGIPYNHPYDLVYNDLIIEAIRKEFREIKEEELDLHPMEKIHKVIYVRPFSTENGEATATGDVRIKKIINKYRDELDKLYESDKDFKVLELDRRNI